ncbi:MULTISPECIES: hypothetical protein [Haloferacaceae]|uniref:hypothetical protein n=1 Tax=Haloferacaceae TaxID=1644056 RepID=UPI00203F25E9|nr:MULTISPECIES: hypothetical protein [Haloferacales]MDB2239396.1 hypothetical protein [Halorubrum ezzemoulense]MDB2250021.1 hypothetical protein [Halorubrum ezzemoulense]
MPDTLADEYPEAAPFITEAVEDHGEEWVLENYYSELYPLSQVMAMPEKEELPFFDPDTDETMSKNDQIEMYEAWAEYRENLRTGTKPDK